MNRSRGIQKMKENHALYNRTEQKFSRKVFHAELKTEQLTLFTEVRHNKGNKIYEIKLKI